MLAKDTGRRYARRMTICCYVESPVGRLALEADGEALTGVRWASPGERSRNTPSPLLKEAARQLGRYFARKLTAFDLPLAARGNTLGVIALGRDASSEPFTDADRQFCEDIARRAALAIDNARLYQRAQDAVRQRDVVLGIVSHDLRNPLSAIGMCVTGLEHGLQHDPAERAELLSAIRDSVDWAQGLIADLLDIASIESGKLAVEARPLDPVILIARAAHFFDPAAREKSVSLTATAPDEIPAIMADERRTLQVLSNLVSNALKHTRPGGHIRVTAQPADREVVFAVEDDGPGLSVEQRAKIGKRGMRLDETKPGSGLGLSIVSDLAASYRGRLTLEASEHGGLKAVLGLPAA